MIPDQIINQINSLPIVKVIESYMKLKDNAGTWEGCCPLHKEKTPSFKVFPKNNNFKCFGRVLGMDTNGSNQIIKGQVPLAEILKYAPDLRSMTSGRGNFTYTDSHYEEVPSYIADKIIAASKKEEE